jgi:hypothetical protein
MTEIKNLSRAATDLVVSKSSTRIQTYVREFNPRMHVVEWLC